MSDTNNDIIIPSLAHKWDDKKRTEDVEIDNNISFAKMMLSDNVFKGLEANGFSAPSPIQLRAIPLGRCNLDLLVQAKAGTGKTLVFVTIILEKFSPDIHAPQSLVIVPTREIAVQIESVFMAIGSCTKGFKVGCFIGGMDITEDRQKIQHCRSIIGTPGRILHLIKNKILNINEIKTFVLDEADQLVDKSFENDVIRIWETLPQRVQSLALSATFSNDLDKKLLKFMSSNHICVSPKREPAILRGVQQFIYNNSDNNENVNSMETKSLKNLTSAKLMLEKVLQIIKIFQMVSFKQCLIFSNSQSRAESYCNYLRTNNWSADVIIGSQDQPTRLKIFKKFRTCQTRILCASDLMARGIDSENVNLVINLDIPISSSVYLHRIGRCGRFGSEGIAITFIDNNWQLVKFRKLLGYIGGNKMTCYMYPKLFDLNISLNDAIKDYNYVKQLQCITGLIEQNDTGTMNTQTDDNELFANVLIDDTNIQESTNKNEQFISMLLKNNVENVDEKSDKNVDEKSDENDDEKSDENVDEKAENNDSKTEEINQETVYQIAENLNLLNISKLLIDNSQCTNENTIIKFNNNNIFESYRQYEFDSIQADSELPQLYQNYMEQIIDGNVQSNDDVEQSLENLKQNYKNPKENQDDLQQFVKGNMFDPQEVESKLLFLDAMKRYQLEPSSSVLLQNEMIVKNDTTSQYVNESESVFKSSSSLSASMSIKLPKSSSSSSMSNDSRSQLSSLSASVSTKIPESSSSSSSSSSSISNDSRSQLSSSLSTDENRVFVKNTSCTNRISTQPNSFSSACIDNNINNNNNNNNNNNININNNNNNNHNSININNSKINNSNNNISNNYNNNNNNNDNNQAFLQSFEDSKGYTNYHQIAYRKWYQQYWNQITAITNAVNYSKYVREFK